MQMFNSDSKRVAYVVTCYRPDNKQLAEEISAHRAAGINIQIVSLERDEFAASHRAEAVTFLPTDNVAESWLRQRSSAHFKHPNAIVGYTAKEVLSAIFLSEFTSDRSITHLHATSSGLAADVARLAARLAGITYSFKVASDENVSIDSPESREKFADATMVFVDGDARIPTSYPADAQRVQFKKLYQDNALLALKYAAPAQREPLIVTYATEESLSRLNDLLNACRILVRRHCRFSCEVFGNISLERSIESAIQNAALGEYVKFAEYVEQSSRDVEQSSRDAITRASVLAITSEEAEFLRLAMALGTPCLLSDDCSAAEFVVDGETGIIEPRHYPDAMAISIQRLLNDDSLRIRLAQEARRSLEQRFGVAENAAGMREYFGVRQHHSALLEAVTDDEFPK